MPRAIVAGLTYFALVFATGFALGTIRVLWLAPRVGDRAAEIGETPLMVVASWLAARWVVGRMVAPIRLGERIAVGGIGLALLLALELGVVRALRGISLGEAIGGRDPVAFGFYLAALAAFALLPLRVHRAAGTHPPTPPTTASPR